MKSVIYARTGLMMAIPSHADKRPEVREEVKSARNLQLARLSTACCGEF